MPAHRPLVVLLLLASSLSAADQVVAAEPLRWTFTSTDLPEWEYQRWGEILAPKLQEIRAATRLRPPFGLLLTNVRDKTPAQAAGLAKGDVVTHMDGVQLPDASSFNRRRNGQPQTITVWTVAEGERVIPIKPGLIGISHEESWSPAHGYWATRVDAAPWEDDLLFAALVLERDVRVAERALVRAQERGCTHPTWIALMASVALHLGWLPEATRFARTALERVPANERLPVAKLLYRSLIAQGLIPQAQEVTRQYDVLSYEDDHAEQQRRLDASVEPFRQALAAHPVMDIRDLCRPRLDEVDHGRALVYLSGPQQRVAEDLARLDPDGDLVFQGKERTDGLNRDGGLRFASHRDRLDLTRVGPLMRDLDFAITCRLEDDGAQFKTSMGAYAIGIADHQAPESNILLRLRITEDSKIQVRVAGLPEYEIRRMPFGIYRDHRLQVRIREHTLGVFVDDLVVYHGPLLEDPAKRQLGLDLYTRDLKGAWSDLTWRGVFSAQDLPVLPVDTARPKPPPIGADNFF